MDQGFNDDELADIMNEIENLEKEFADDDQQQNVAPVAQQQEEEQEVEQEQYEQHDEPQHHVEQQVAQMDDHKIEQANSHAHDDQNVHHLQQKTDSQNWQQSSMEFSVQGNMKLALKFHVGGQTVFLNIDQHNFDIELDHGMKFSLPLDHKKSA